MAAKAGDVDFRVRIGGQANIDCGVYLGADDHRANRNGISVNDCRLAVIADIDTVWQAKLEVSYQASKVSFKDVYVQRSSGGGGREAKFGNFFFPFGVLRGGLFFKFVDTSTADVTFSPWRKLGVAYQSFSDNFNWGVGIFSAGDVDKGKMLNQGYSYNAYALVRPIVTSSSVLHLSVSGILTHPSDKVSFAAPAPLMFTSHSLVKTEDMDAYNYGRLEVAALGMVRRFYAEAHFLKAWVNTPNELRTMADDGVVSVSPQSNYDGAYGFYVQAAWRIVGDDHARDYHKKMGLAFNAARRALDVLVRFDRTDLDQFGAANNLTLGVNYYINKYLRVRLNYVHAAVKAGADMDALCSRVQFSF